MDLPDLIGITYSHYLNAWTISLVPLWDTHASVTTAIASVECQDQRPGGRTLLQPPNKLRTIRRMLCMRKDGICTRSSHLNVACWSVCYRNQDFWSRKNVPDCLIVPFWSSWSLHLAGQRSDCSHPFLILWFSQFRGYFDSLIGSQSGLIAWFDFNLSCKRFYMGHISDCPLI